MLPPLLPSTALARSFSGRRAGAGGSKNLYKTNERSTFLASGHPRDQHRSQERPKKLQGGPMKLQEAPQRPPRGIQESPRSSCTDSRSFHGCPRGSQEPPKTSQVDPRGFQDNPRRAPQETSMGHKDPPRGSQEIRRGN